MFFKNQKLLTLIIIDILFITNTIYFIKEKLTADYKLSILPEYENRVSHQFNKVNTYF
jgi:hypothetical protein